jgi:hypothetical protein
MILFDPNEPGWFSCSGTLLNATVFLTAGHCTFNIGTDGEAEGSSGGNDVWVTVAPEDVLEGFPPRADFPDEATLYAARSAWLNANPDYIKGTAFPSPLYDEFSAFPANHDVGVVVLDIGIAVGSYGELAPLGSVETLLDASAGPNDAIVETVGYGIQSVQPHPMNVDSRFKSTSRIVQNVSNITDGGNLHTLNDPSAVGGTAARASATPAGQSSSTTRTTCWRWSRSASA